MRYGNCLLAAFWLWASTGGRGRVVYRSQPPYGVPHFYYVDAGGVVFSYDWVADVMPGPWWWLFFRGKYRRCHHLPRRR